MKKIDLMIVGAQKAGTTSLKNYLGEHPDIAVHITKEFAYFQSEMDYEKGFEVSYKRSYPSNKGRVIVAKNAGLYEKELFLTRLKEHNKDCKIVFILRNPVDRAFSSYLMEKREGFIDFDSDHLAKILNPKNPIDKNFFRKFIELGIYSEHLKNIYSNFQKENVMVFTFEQLKSNGGQVCKDIFSSLNLNTDIEINTGNVYNERKNIRSKKMARLLNQLKREDNLLKLAVKKILPYHLFLKITGKLKSINYSAKGASDEKMSVETREKLVEFFKPYNQELSSMLDIDFSYWDIIR